MNKILLTKLEKKNFLNKIFIYNIFFTFLNNFLQQQYNFKTH